MGICIDTLRTWLQGCRWVRSVVPTGNSGVSGNWRRKSAPCASSLWRKMRSLTFKKTRRHPVQTIADKHRCAQTLHCQGTPVEQACRVLEISRSGYYGWAQHNPCARERRNQALRRRLWNCTRTISPWTVSATRPSRNSAVPASVSTGRCGLRGSPL